MFNNDEEFKGNTLKEIRDNVLLRVENDENKDKYVVLFQNRRCVHDKSSVTYQSLCVNLNEYKKTNDTVHYTNRSINLDDWIKIISENGHIVIVLICPETKSNGKIVRNYYGSFSPAISNRGLIASIQKFKLSYDIIFHFTNENKTHVYGGLKYTEIFPLLSDIESLPIEWIFSNKEHGESFTKILKRLYKKKLPFIFYQNKQAPIQRIVHYLNSVNHYNEHTIIDRTPNLYESIIDFQTRESLSLIGSQPENIIDVLCPCNHPWGVEIYKSWIEHPQNNRDIIKYRHNLFKNLVSNPSQLVKYIKNINKILSPIKYKTWNDIWKKQEFTSVESLYKIYRAINNFSQAIHRLSEHKDPPIKVVEYDAIVNHVMVYIWNKYPITQNMDENNIFVIADYSFSDLRDKLNEQLKMIIDQFIDQCGLSKNNVRYNKDQTAIIVPHTIEWSCKINNLELDAIELSEVKYLINLPILKSTHDKYNDLVSRMFNLASIRTYTLLEKIKPLQDIVFKIQQCLGTEECVLKIAQQMLQRKLILPIFHNSMEIIVDGITLPNPNMPLNTSRNSRIKQQYPLYNVKNNGMFNIDNVSMIHGTTGSGKSSFLRIIGVNTVLAHAGLPVFAKRMNLPLLSHIYMHTGINDSLENGVSSFKREMLRLNSILNNNEKSKSLILTDELHQCVRQDIGENLLKCLINYITNKCTQTICIMSTHHVIKSQINRKDYVFRDDHTMNRGTNSDYNIEKLLQNYHINNLLFSNSNKKLKL
jgi:DNA mismatch repair ATPase MutS